MPEKEKGRRVPGRYEALAISYANRSAALRRLSQFEDCLKDVSRAAWLGYPKENLYKLWERKGKCYQGLKKYDLAAKCYRQALQSLKESMLSDSLKAGKAAEIQGLLKELKNILLKLGPTAPAFTEFEAAAAGGDSASAVRLVDAAATASRAIKPSSPTSASPQTPLPEAPRRANKSQNKMAVVGEAAAAVVTEPVKGAEIAALSKTTSQVSITGSIKMEVPELSYGHNPRLPSASNAIDLQFSPERGRYFVATQDLFPGDVILKEEPYAAVLESVFRVNHCAHCLKKTSTPIPCFECATVQFCSEACRDDSWRRYHYVECGILAYLEPSQFLGRLPHLGLRIITKTGLQTLVRHTQRELSGSPEPAAASAAGPIAFDPTSYRSVHNLATNSDKRSFEDLLKKTSEAIFMSKCLKFNGFYGETKDFTAEQQRAEIFVSSLILRHLQIGATNGLEMAECILKNQDITKFDIVPIGGAIFPTISFFNHSCYPNAMRIGYPNQQMIRVVRLIPKGAEVNIDYGFDFYATPIEYRQRRAAANYHFECSCVACINKWPVYDRLVDLPPQYTHKLTPRIIEEVAKQAEAYTVAMEHLVRLDINRALPILAEYLTVMSELIVHPDAR